jgi:predicted nucleic-acid-binding Zn-ribbon protein
MRETQVCPKCRGKRFYVMPEVTQPNINSANGTHALVPTCAWLMLGDGGFFSSNYRRVAAGTFEAWICAACGLTEWYAKIDPEALELLQQARVVRVVEAPSGGPFR